jgi:glucose-induced degradation protein 8
LTCKGNDGTTKGSLGPSTESSRLEPKLVQIRTPSRVITPKVNPNVREFDKLILEHFIVEGFGQVVDKFCKEAALPLPSNLYDISARFEIRKAVESGNMPAAISLLNDLNPELLEIDRKVHFAMIIQRLIELFRADQLEEALAYGQDVVAPVVEENPEVYSPKMEQVMMLALFPQSDTTLTVPPELQELYSQEHRCKTAQSVNQSILSFLSEEREPVGTDFPLIILESKLPTLLKLYDWCSNALGAVDPVQLDLDKFFN